MFKAKDSSKKVNKQDKYLQAYKYRGWGWHKPRHFKLLKVQKGPKLAGPILVWLNHANFLSVKTLVLIIHQVFIGYFGSV